MADNFDYDAKLSNTCSERDVQYLPLNVTEWKRKVAETGDNQLKYL